MSTESQRRVRIYTTRWCGFCHRAKQLLSQEAIEFEEIPVDGDPETRAWLREQSGQHTVPQIFFDEESIGGCQELETLWAQKELHAKLRPA